MKKIITTTAVFALFILALSSSAFDILDPDTANYLAYGRYITQNGLPHGCVFTFSIKNCPIPYSEWLLQLGVYLIYTIGSWPGLVLFQISIVMTIFLAIYLTNQKKSVSPVITLAISIASLFIISERFMLRADLFAMPLSAFMYLLLVAAEKKQLFSLPLKHQLKTLLPLLFIQLLWVNTHGSYLFGWLIVLAFLFSKLINYTMTYILLNRRKNRRQSLAEVLCLLFYLTLIILISFLNPYGLATFIFTISNAIDTNSKVLVRSIGEYASPFAQLEFQRISLRMYKIFLYLAPAVLILNWKKLKIYDLFLMFVFLAVSATAIRFMAVFGLFAALILPEYLQLSAVNFLNFLKKNFRISLPLSLLSSLILLLISMLSLYLSYKYYSDEIFRYNRSPRRFGFGLSKITYPAGAADFILKNKLRPNMFNSYVFGGYFNWRLFPKYKTYIHGSAWSLDVLDSLWFYADYRNINMGKINYSEVAEKNNINFFVLEYPNDLTRELVTNLQKDPDWALVFLNFQSVIYLKRTPENAPIIKKYGINLNNVEDFAASSGFSDSRDLNIVYFNLAKLLKINGKYEQAKYFLRKAIDIGDPDYQNYTYLASLFGSQGRIVEAMANYHLAINQEPSFLPAHEGLGEIYLKQGIYQKAEKEYKYILSVNPEYPWANYYLGSLSEMKGRRDLAKKYYLKELKLNPSHKPALDALMKIPA